MITYPNQKIIHINKDASTDFLQVDKSSWMDACNELTYNGFKVYLYLAGNQDGFDLALSRKALQDNIVMHDNTYTKVIKELTEKGYLVHKQGNIYDFYLIPHSSVETCHTTVGYNTTLQCGDIPHSSGGEIDKRDKIDNLLYKELADAQTTEEKKNRTLRDLSKEELNNLLNDYSNEVKYVDLQKKYNVSFKELNKELPNTIDSIFKDREKEDKLAIFKEFLTEETKQELCKLLNADNDEEFFELISGLTVKMLPDELLNYLKDDDIFTYKRWIKDYAHTEDYREMTYYKWFTDGVSYNYEKTYSWDY